MKLFLYFYGSRVTFNLRLSCIWIAQKIIRELEQTIFLSVQCFKNKLDLINNLSTNNITIVAIIRVTRPKPGFMYF